MGRKALSVVTICQRASRPRRILAIPAITSRPDSTSNHVGFSGEGVESGSCIYNAMETEPVKTSKLVGDGEI
jgi:hypothetical protein